MTHTPDYQIKIPGKTIGLLFNTWTYRRYCEKNGLDLQDLIDKINNTIPAEEGEPQKTGVKFHTTEYSDLLLVGHESFCKYNDIEFTATDLTANEWIDGMGGIVRSTNELNQIFLLFVQRFLGVGEKKETKKKVVKESQDKHGGSSSSPLLEAV